ncbi:hypothetical protein ACN47E_008015 [Coniothyrium glycines]
MIVPVFLAALAALPAVTAQATPITQTSTRCTIRYGYSSLTPTGTETTVALPTWYTMTTSFYYTTHITTINPDVVTITPNATTTMSIMTTTVIAETTTTTTPTPVTIAAGPGFNPLNAIGSRRPQATGISRVKRAELGPPELSAHDVLALFRRQMQTPAGYTGGFSVDEYGNTTDLNREYKVRMDCFITVSVNETLVQVVQGPNVTVTTVAQVMTALSTSTVTSTVTVTEIAPTPSVYAACQDNNVVNHVTDFDGNTLVFTRVLYRPAEGLPMNTELVVNTTSPVNCCIACQTTSNCAGSFYVPSRGNCHIRLTQPSPSTNTTDSAFPTGLPAPPTNSTHGLYSLATGTGLPHPPLSTTPVTATLLSPYNASASHATSLYTPPSNSNATCSQGGRSLYMGAIQGFEDYRFPIDKALFFSNGPCGYFSVWPLAINPNRDNSVSDPVPGRPHPFDRI